MLRWSRPRSGRPDNDYVDRTGLARRRIVNRGFQKALKMQPQTFGSATEDSGKACSAAPGTPKKLGRAPAAITRCDPCNVLPSASERVRMDRSAAATTSTEGYSLKMVPVGAGDVLGGDLGAGHLVEQRLELVVIVAVNQRHLDPGITELAGAGHTSEPATKNQHSFTHPKHPPRPSQ
jgi:hypothetical protein